MIGSYLHGHIQSTTGWFLHCPRCARGRHLSPCPRLARWISRMSYLWSSCGRLSVVVRSRHIVAAQAGILAGCEGLAALLYNPQRGASVSAPPPVYQKQATKDENAGERGGEHSVSLVAPRPVLSNGINSGKERSRRTDQHAGR